MEWSRSSQIQGGGGMWNLHIQSQNKLRPPPLPPQIQYVLPTLPCFSWKELYYITGYSAATAPSPTLSHDQNCGSGTQKMSSTLCWVPLGIHDFHWDWVSSTKLVPTPFHFNTRGAWPRATPPFNHTWWRILFTILRLSHLLWLHT